MRYSLLLTIAVLMTVASKAYCEKEDVSISSVAQPAPALDQHFVLQIEANMSFLSELVAGESQLGSFAYSLRLGYRRKGWDGFVFAEHGFWKNSHDHHRLNLQLLNVGLGVGYAYFEEHMHGSLTIGASVLLTEVQMDEPGTTGVFLDARPTGFRWPIRDKAVIELHPLTFAVVIPVLEGIPLAYISYRTALILELQF